MQYIVVFLEGIVTFISPCLLPMLPVYVSYFMGGDQSRTRALRAAMGFVFGFTAVFVAMGAFAGTLGSLVSGHRQGFDIAAGAVVVLFGLSHLGVFGQGIFKFMRGAGEKRGGGGFFASALMGVVFSVSWTPCVGAFLGSALALASQQGSAGRGVLMLFLYSLGLGVPFMLSAMLIERLKGAFDFIKRNYKVINAVSGAFLILVGLLMMSGLLGRMLSALA